MRLETRLTKSFVEIKVYEMETTIFSSSEQELEDTINNLIGTAIELTSYTKKSIKDYLREYED